MDAKDKNYIAGINPLRFFAAFGIIVYHSTLGRTGHFPSFLKLFIHNLPICVDFFFIISGFLITYLLLVEKEKKKSISIRNFYFRRILRIFPLYYVVIGIAYLNNNAVTQITGFNKYLFFAGNFSMIENNQWPDLILSPLWSICIEEHFYLLIPFVLSIISSKQVPKFLFAVVILSILFRIFALETGASWMYLYCHSVGRSDVIAIGGLLGYSYFKNRLTIKSSELASLCLIFGTFVLMGILDFSDFENLLDVSIKKYLIIVPLMILFAIAIMNQKTNILFRRISNSAVLNYLGRISYGLYMYHMVVISFMSQTTLFKERPILGFFLIVITTSLIAMLSYELFEKQILKFKSRFKPY